MVLPEALRISCGLGSGALSLAAIGVYLLDILRGGTRPSRSTWWVFALLNLTIVATYYAAGARETVWLPASYGVGFLAVAVLSLRYGEAAWTTLDTLCLGGAVLGLVAWLALGSATAALAVLVAVDAVGMGPTLLKAWRRPWSESRSAWLVGALASLLNVAAVGSWSIVVAGYPLYLLAVNGAAAALVLAPRRPPASEAIS
jgi:hypothetical protein